MGANALLEGARPRPSRKQTGSQLFHLLRPSHQTLKRCPSGWGKGLRCCPSLRYFIKHICQNERDNERSLLAKHEAVRLTKYLVWQRNGLKNGVPSFDYLRLVADDNIAVAVFSIVCSSANELYIFELLS